MMVSTQKNLLSNLRINLKKKYSTEYTMLLPLPPIKIYNTNCVNSICFFDEIRRQQRQQQTNSKRKNYVDDNRPLKE